MHFLRTLLCCTCLAGAARAQELLQTWSGPEARSGFGATVVGVGDIDGDGTDDVMIGAPNYKDDPGFQGAKGFVGVYSGATGSTIHRYVGTHAEPNAGHALAAGGDIDADGVGDFLFAGAENCCFASVVEVHSGKTGASLFEFQGIWPDTWDLGNQLLADLDLDLDGFDDFLVTTSAGGELRAYSGQDGTELWVLVAQPGMQGFGSGLASLGDLDGDGVRELALGSQAADRVDVLSGSTGTTPYTIAGRAGERFGAGIANVGDLDADGFDDLVVGAPGFPVFSSDGRAWVHSGFDGTQLFELRAGAPGSRFPASLAGPGDLDGDGIPEVVAGSSHDDELFPDGGRVTVFSGADGSVLRVHYGAEVGAHFGSAVAGVGDLDGRGVTDLAIGASSGLPFSNGAGEVQVLASERSLGVYCTAKTNSAGCTPTIWSSGVPSLSASTFRLTAQSVLNEQRGVLVWGLHPARMPFEGGVSCVGSIQGRKALWSGGNPTAALSAPDCSGSLRDDWPSTFLAGSGLVPGQSVYAQFRFVDPGDPQGLGLTDALRFDVLP